MVEPGRRRLPAHGGGGPDRDGAARHRGGPGIRWPVAGDGAPGARLRPADGRADAGRPGGSARCGSRAPARRHHVGGLGGHRRRPRRGRARGRGGPARARRGEPRRGRAVGGGEDLPGAAKEATPPRSADTPSAWTDAPPASADTRSVPASTVPAPADTTTPSAAAPSVPADMPRRASSRPALLREAAAGRRPPLPGALWPPLVLLFGITALYGGYSVVWAVYLRDLGARDSLIAWSAACLALPALVLSPRAGAALPRVSRRLLVRCAALLLGCCACLYPVLGSVAAAVALSFTEGVLLAVALPLISAQVARDAAPAARRGPSASSARRTPSAVPWAPRWAACCSPGEVRPRPSGSAASCACSVWPPPSESPRALSWPPPHLAPLRRPSLPSRRASPHQKPAGPRMYHGLPLEYVLSAAETEQIQEALALLRDSSAPPRGPPSTTVTGTRRRTSHPGCAPSWSTSVAPNPPRRW